MGLAEDDIPIKYVGLRPGEKLSEELQLDGEKAVSTTHKKIKIWRSDHLLPRNITDDIEILLNLAQSGAPREKIIQKLKELVPEYEPWNPPL